MNHLSNVIQRIIIEYIGFDVDCSIIHNSIDKFISLEKVEKI